ncbi:Glycosyltransferase [Gloeomargarita lithophora Alchichica-D10]|uniref:Glycosyltransferase n=1 Tax=Gloeomargarita lithophora Alchichica-D10 TaxID=1188229 RepID=A0A1J0AH22_9CYAN|nr:glycosyltransferase [Gloeomargarita lithophora]APB35244.1 Glycosyltransferase [Gloeomargarita lithophora Alchichica-D10]
MRKLYFLVPGTTKAYHCGGLWAELKLLELAQSVGAATLVTYQQREPGHLFLGDCLSQPPSPGIFVVSWGFHVAKLIPRLKPYPVIYHAHSTGYGFGLPVGVPVVTVSRNSMGYWGQKAPHAPIYYLPNVISDEFDHQGKNRDIDVLIMARKSSAYLLQHLAPQLQKHCRVEVVDYFVPSLADLFNRSRVYLYDSALYWAVQGVSEGFGLQPLEAMACGCHVFSSVNGGLADYLDPGVNCEQIGCYDSGYDLVKILRALNKPTPPISLEFLQEYRAPQVKQKLGLIWQALDEFFDYQQAHGSDIAPVTRRRIWHLRIQQWGRKAGKLLKKSK